MKNLIPVAFLVSMVNATTPNFFKASNKIYTKRCYDAFDYIKMPKAKHLPTKITTKIQGKEFYLKIVKYCPNTILENVTLVSKNFKKVDYKIKGIFPFLILDVKNSYKDLRVNFKYKIFFTKKKNFKEEKIRDENSSDNFSVRPYEFKVNEPNTFVGKLNHPKIEAVGYKNNISTNYNVKLENLKVSTNNKNPIKYFFIFRDGKAQNTQFIFSKEGNTSLKISEIIGKEWAIVDENDTSDNRRLIPCSSNNFSIQKNSKEWFGVSTGNKEFNPSKRTINSNIKNNVNRDSSFIKIFW